MSGPVSDNKTPGHQMYAPNTVTQQRVDSPPMSPSHAQVSPSHAQVQADRRSPSFGEDLEDEVRRQPYEPEPISQPQSRRREYFGLRLINWIVIAVACTTLSVIIGTITKPL